MAEAQRYQIVLASAVVVALGATYGVHRVLEQIRATNHVATAPVVVAANDVGEGARFERLDVTVVQLPVAAVPAGGYAVPDSVVGRVARIPVFKGEPVLPGRLAPAGVGPGIEVKITPGKRAMAVKINDVTGIAGLIQPNSRVDVLVTLKDETTGQNTQRAKVFMNNMRVLSVGTQVERGADGKPINATVATLEVTPEETERLAVATSQGAIQLVLRGYGDPDSIRTRGATSTDVLTQLEGAGAVPRRPAPAAPAHPAASRPARFAARANPAPPSAPAPAPAPARADSAIVQVYRGDKISQQKFEHRDPAEARTAEARTAEGKARP